MKINHLSVIACAVIGSTALAYNTQAQTIVGLTGALSPENWTFTSDFSPTDYVGHTPGSQAGDNPLDGPDESYAEFCDCTDLEISGPYNYDTGLSGPITMSASVTIPFTASLRFDYGAIAFDYRGWGDGVDTYNRVGYTITRGGSEFANVSLGGTEGDIPVFTPGFNFEPGPRYKINLEAGDILSFYVFTDGLGDDSAILYANNFTLSSVPEPGEWIALAGVGLMGFAGVRRWRQNKAA